MGLFGKGKHHSVTEKEWSTLVNEMTIMRARLEAAEQAKSGLENRLRALDATTAGLADDRTRIETVELRARVVELEAQLAAVATQAAKAELASEIAERVAEQVEQVVQQQADAPAPAAPVVVEPAVFDTSEIDAKVADIVGQLGHLAERMSGTDASVRGLHEQVALVQQRLAAVSTELANQITELSGDIDALARLGDASPDAAVSEEVVEALRSAQVRLAAEQARYEIAFRQDLADLADRLSRRH